MYIIFVLIILSQVYNNSLEFVFDENKELFEGSQCTLKNGNPGVCKKSPDCPPRENEVLEGTRRSSPLGRCGFDGSIEIVCCPVNITEEFTCPPTEAGGRKCTLDNGYLGICKDDIEIVCSPRHYEEFRYFTGRPAEIACLNYFKSVTASYCDIIMPPIYIGDVVAPLEMPFMAAVGYIDESDGSSIRYDCGGSLISYQHVLTAAHCTSNIEDRVPVEVRLGGNDLSITTEEVQRIPISDIIIHPLYRRSRSYNDIAILKLKTEVQFSMSVKPICLETRSLDNIEYRLSSFVIMAGWGATGYGMNGSNELLKSPSHRIVDTKTCDPFYRDFSKLPQGIDKRLICTKDTNTTRLSDACQGDSGGPLILQHSTRNTLIGITATGQSCGSASPAISTAIYPYLDWIEKQVWHYNKMDPILDC